MVMTGKDSFSCCQSLNSVVLNLEVEIPKGGRGGHKIISGGPSGCRKQHEIRDRMLLSAISALE